MTARISFYRTLSLAAVIGLAAVPVAPAMAEETPASPSAAAEVKSAEEKALEQQLSADEPIATGKVSIDAGHVDMGPKFVDGAWQLMVHDDTTTDPVWRSIQDVVMVGKDAAKLPVPDDERYSFVDAASGSDVYVIPQTEAEGVVWPGWNTQDPQVVEALGRGVTLTLDGVEGPGQMTVYLENGNFSAPQVLWNSSKDEPQDIWVEPNTHTHANWVFTAPGAYFVTVTAHATLADGSEVSNTQRIQFAIGSETNPDDVFAQAQKLPPLAGGETSADTKGGDKAEGGDDASSSATSSSAAGASEAATNTAEEESSGMSPALLIGVAVAVFIGGGVAYFASRSAAAKKQAKEQLK